MLPRVSFEELLVNFKVLEFSHGYVPDCFLTSLGGVVVYSSDLSLAMGRDLLADSILSYLACFFDPMSPTPCSSRDGDSIIPYFVL